jgi:methylmalonyl-CoA mutase
MSKENNLFNEFDSVSLAEWKTKIEKDLKEKPLSSLTWDTKEDININPYFNKENSFNYNKTTPSKIGVDNSWAISHLINITNEGSANEEALKVLTGGVNSITFKGDFEDIAVLLKDILIDIISINFVTENPAKVIKKLNDFCSKNNINKANINGTISYDYIGKNNIEELKNNISNSEKLNIKHINLSNSETINAGANITQQLAIIIAQGNEYLKNAFTDAEQFQFNLSLGGNYFFEIAKIRALRILWSNMLAAYNIKNTSTTIHCATSTLLWSKTDNENNILRASSTAMSAIIGGCDSLTITPHNLKNDDFSNRVAKNIQILLKEEAYLDKVKDPANGSYYIEHLTNTLAQNSWRLFQEIEENGGYLKSIKDDLIPNLVSKSGKELIDRFSKGEIIIIGVTKYSNEGVRATLTQESNKNTTFSKIVLKEN